MSDVQIMQLKRQLHQERQEKETLLFQLRTAPSSLLGPVDAAAAPEFTAIPVDAAPYVGKMVRVRAADGEPTLVYLGVTLTTGATGWVAIGQSE